jgi:hypothetical protein
MLRTATVIPAASSKNISVGWVTEIFLRIIWVFLSEANPLRNWKPDHWFSRVRIRWWNLIERKKIKILRPRWDKTPSEVQVFRVLCARFNAQDCIFNVQELRIIIIIVQVGAMKTYVVVVKAQEIRKIGWNSVWMIMYFFAGFYFNLTLCMTKLRVVVVWRKANVKHFLWMWMKGEKQP